MLSHCLRRYHIPRTSVQTDNLAMIPANLSVHTRGAVLLAATAVIGAGQDRSPSLRPRTVWLRVRLGIFRV